MEIGQQIMLCQYSNSTVNLPHWTTITPSPVQLVNIWLNIGLVADQHDPLFMGLWSRAQEVQCDTRVIVLQILSGGILQESKYMLYVTSSLLEQADAQQYKIVQKL